MAHIVRQWDSFNRRYNHELRGMTGADSILNGTILAVEGNGIRPTAQIADAIAEINARRSSLGLSVVCIGNPAEYVSGDISLSSGRVMRHRRMARVLRHRFGA